MPQVCRDLKGSRRGMHSALRAATPRRPHQRGAAAVDSGRRAPGAEAKEAAHEGEGRRIPATARLTREDEEALWLL